LTVSYKETTQTKGKNAKPGKFCPGGPKWGMEYAVFFNILELMGEKHSLQKSFVIMKKTHAKNGCIC
jgi:hypothetical protein